MTTLYSATAAQISQPTLGTQLCCSHLSLLELKLASWCCRSTKFIVSGGADKLLKVWDLAAALAAEAPADGGKPAKLKATAATAAHDKDINAVAVAPNDSLICTASQDRTAKVRLCTALGCPGWC